MFYSDLKTVDVLFGLLILALAVFNIITRSRLANYKSDALMFLNINNAAAAGVTILYALVASAVINVNVIEAQQVGQISGSIIVIVINTIYFGKRKHLFVN